MSLIRFPLELPPVAKPDRGESIARAILGALILFLIFGVLIYIGLSPAVNCDCDTDSNCEQVCGR